MDKLLNTACMGESSKLSELQHDILEFAKREHFHATLDDYVSRNNVDKSKAIEALKDLKLRRIVSMPPDILNGPISVTNYGWRIMGWK